MEIADGLEGLTTPIEELKPHPENPRQGDVGAIKDSLEEFGQVRPIVATKDSVIVAGHHVYYAAKELGATEIAVVKPDLTEEQARRYLVADNRLSDLGRYDDAALASILEDIMGAGQLKGTGWEPDTVDDLLAEIGAVAETPGEDFTGDYVESPEETADRWNANEDGEPINPMREVILMLRSAEFDEFAENLRQLKTVYELDATTATVQEAIRREAARHEKAGPPPAES